MKIRVDNGANAMWRLYELSGSLRCVGGVAAILLLLTTGGCIDHTASLSLTTLPNGDSIRIHEVWRKMRVEQRRIQFCPRTGEAQTLIVSPGKRWPESENSPYGFDVLQDGSQITVWKLAGGTQEALATVTVKDGDSAKLAAPHESVNYIGKRIGCSIHRRLFTAKVGEGESVCLSMSSKRDVGSDANKDSFWLGWYSEEQDKRTTESRDVGTTILTLEGQTCLSDPLYSCPNFDLRWDDQRKAAWVVDTRTNQIVGGFQVAPWFFDRDSVPKYAAATTGRVIASVRNP